MALMIYDTFERKKREFVTNEAGKVRMYACGITVYDDCHMGHAFQAVVFDMIRRYLEYKGYEVTYVRNFTDVDDKIINRAKVSGVPALEISDRYVRETRKDLDMIKTGPATFEPRVSEHIDDIISFISGLIDRGTAYRAENGDVWFSVKSFPAYGALSNRKVDDMISEERGTKRHPADFCLWKAAKPGEPCWPSPWGQGRPGWHIECSAMSRKFLGDTFDIHGGGHDLVFPHHENEIAQTESLTGKKYVNYWIHNGLVMVDKQKMSKSLGNFMTVKVILGRHVPDTIRYMILSCSYSSNVDFSETNLDVAEKRVHYYYTALEKIDRAAASDDGSGRNALEEITGSIARDIENCMDDDFNSARVLAKFSDWFKAMNDKLEDRKIEQRHKAATARAFRKAFEVPSKLLRLLDDSPTDVLAAIRSNYLRRIDMAERDILELLKERSAAREFKDFAKADEIRDTLKRVGIKIMDDNGASSWDIVF